MVFKGFTQKASLFFLSVLFSVFTLNVQADTSCKAKKIDQWLKADYAIDGDTIVIQKHRYRLNGIYAPQIEKKQKMRTPGQPMAKAAQAYLNKLLANADLEVGVEFDETKFDRFNRRLVHLHLKDGTNIQEKMIEKGLVLAYTHDGNALHDDCYFLAEKFARRGQYNLWDLAVKRPEFHFPIVDSNKLSVDDLGFRIIRGEVKKVDKSSNNYIINLDTTGIRVRKEFWDQFDYDKLEKLEGKTIEVRGFGFLYKQAMFVVIDHPNAINLLSPVK